MIHNRIIIIDWGSSFHLSNSQQWTTDSHAKCRIRPMIIRGQMLESIKQKVRVFVCCRWAAFKSDHWAHKLETFSYALLSHSSVGNDRSIGRPHILLRGQLRPCTLASEHYRVAYSLLLWWVNSARMWLLAPLLIWRVYPFAAQFATHRPHE